MSRRMWKLVEASAEKIGMREIEKRRSKRRKRQEEETEKGEDDGSKEGGRGMGNMG